MHRMRWLFGVSLFISSTLPVMAQETTDVNTNWVRILTNVTALTWLIGSMVAFYLLSVLFTIATSRSGYPPNMARMGCWLSLTLWVLFVAFILFGQILAIHLPIWFLVGMILAVIFVGLVLWSTRGKG